MLFDITPEQALLRQELYASERHGKVSKEEIQIEYNNLKLSKKFLFLIFSRVISHYGEVDPFLNTFTSFIPC